MHCSDCGTKYSDGLCPNCHEEAFIMDTQGEYMDRVPDEFAWMAETQRKQAKAALGTYREQMRDAGRGHLLRETD